MLIILIYQTPSKIGTFIADFIETLHTLPLPLHHGTVVLGNFIIDQRSQGNVSLLAQLLQEFSFIQCSRFLTHAHGGIQDIAS